MVGLRELLCLLAPTLLFNLGNASSQEVLAGKKQPNIVFILTDDQDLHMESISYMPYLKKHITNFGTTFSRHYCTVALCCPSRVSLWTGKAAHNTNVTDVHPPYGMFSRNSVAPRLITSLQGGIRNSSRKGSMKHISQVGQFDQLPLLYSLFSSSLAL